jgi:hypothetical protein
MESAKYFTAICFDFNEKPYKYRNIKNSARTVLSFEKYCAGKQIMYINYYDKASRQFVCRKYRQTGGTFAIK